MVNLTVEEQSNGNQDRSAVMVSSSIGLLATYTYTTRPGVYKKQESLV